MNQMYHYRSKELSNNERDCKTKFDCDVPNIIIKKLIEYFQEREISVDNNKIDLIICSWNLSNRMAVFL